MFRGRLRLAIAPDNARAIQSTECLSTAGQPPRAGGSEQCAPRTPPAAATILAVSNPTTATSDPDTDAAIVALVDKIVVSYRQSNRLSKLQEATTNRIRKAQLQDQIRALVKEGWDMRANLAAIRPTRMTRSHGPWRTICLAFHRQ
jgi:hypothetical protein